MVGVIDMPENTKAYETIFLPQLIELLSNTNFELGGKVYECEDIIVGDFKTIWALTGMGWVKKLTNEILPIL